MARLGRGFMAKVLIQAHLDRFAVFQECFVKQAAVRQQAGELSYAVFCVADQRNQVAAILDWHDIDSARAFWESPTAQALMRDWQTNDTPVVELLLDSGEALFFPPEEPIE